MCRIIPSASNQLKRVIRFEQDYLNSYFWEKGSLLLLLIMAALYVVKRAKNECIQSQQK